MRLSLIAAAAMAAAFFVSHAKAANHQPAAVPNGANSWKIEYGQSDMDRLLQRTFVPKGAGNVDFDDLLRVPGPAGKTIDVKATRAVPWSTIARGAARAYPWVAAGMAIWEVYDTIRVKPDGSGGWKHDPGQAEGSAVGYECSGMVVSAGLSPSAACQGPYTAWKNAWAPAKVTVVDPLSCSSAASSGACSARLLVEGYGYAYANFSWQRKTIQQCPAYTDDAGIPHAAGSPKGSDGKCPSGFYNPIPLSDAESKFEQHADKGKAVPYLQEIVGRDGELLPSPPVEVNGQPKVELEPKTRTETDAQGNTKTTTTRDVYNITYQGNTYTWNMTTVTVNSDGSSTEETTPDPVDPPPDPGMPPLPKLYTQKYPEGISGVWNSNSQALKNTPIFQFLAGLNPNLGSGGGCPAYTFGAGNVLGVNVSGDISPPCEVWPFLRIFFVICALLLSRRLIFGG